MRAYYVDSFWKFTKKCNLYKSVQEIEKTKWKLNNIPQERDKFRQI